MKFEISRTSGHSRGVIKPHKDCKLKRVDPDYGTRTWDIELRSLEDLIAFVRDVGHEVIVAEGYEPGSTTAPITLEIYDDYRE